MAFGLFVISFKNENKGTPVGLFVRYEPMIQSTMVNRLPQAHCNFFFLIFTFLYSTDSIPVSIRMRARKKTHREGRGLQPRLRRV